MNSDEQTLVAAISQGKIQEMIQAGVFRFRFDDPYDKFFSACEIVHLRGDPLNLLTIAGECSLDSGVWSELKSIWRQARELESIDWKPAASRISDRNLETEAVYASNLLIEAVRERKPIRNAISGVCTMLQTSLDNNRSYDPTPSSHYSGGNIGVITRKTGLASIDKLIGGIWTQALIIYGVPSNHGKSTMAYTLLAHSVAQRARCSLFTFETNTATAIARILSIYGGFTTDETMSRKGNTKERHESMMASLAEIDRYLSIYDANFNDPEKIESIIRLERPDFAVMDHIGMIDPNSAMRNASRFDQIGDVADASLQITIKYAMTFWINSQLSNSVSAKVKRDHDIAHTELFGSSRVYNAADFVLIGIRHWETPMSAYVKIKKNRKTGVIDVDQVVGYDPTTAAYYQRV